PASHREGKVSSPSWRSGWRSLRRSSGSSEIPTLTRGRAGGVGMANGRRAVLACCIGVLVSASSAFSSDTCRLGKTFAVLDGDTVQREGDLVAMYTKSGTLTLDTSRVMAEYDVTITRRLPNMVVVRKFKGSSRIIRSTTKPDHNWMCELPK